MVRIFANLLAIRIIIIETINTIVAAALINGETPLLNIAQITIGRVFFLPIMKNVTKNSSKDNPKVSIMVPITDGLIRGNVT